MKQPTSGSEAPRDLEELVRKAMPDDPDALAIIRRMFPRMSEEEKKRLYDKCFATEEQPTLAVWLERLKSGQRPCVLREMDTIIPELLNGPKEDQGKVDRS